MLGKVIAINGNLEAPDLGLSSEDRQLLCTEVTVVLHSASSVKFDDTIQKACQINVQGVYTLLDQLALKMDKLEVRNLYFRLEVRDTDCVTVVGCDYLVF